MQLRLKAAAHNAESSTNTTAQKSIKGNPSVSFRDSEALPRTSWEKHYQISDSRKFPLDIGSWISLHDDDDPALEVTSESSFLHITLN